MKHDVILFVPVRVKFVGIEAASHIEAIQIADEALVVDQVIPTRHGPFRAPGNVENRTIDYVEACEGEVNRALVDEEGDEDYERSRYYITKPDESWVVEIGRSELIEAEITEQLNPYAQWRTDCPSCGHDVLIVESVILFATGERHYPRSVLQEDGFDVNCSDELKDQSTEEEVIRCENCGKAFGLSELELVC